MVRQSASRSRVLEGNAAARELGASSLVGERSSGRRQKTSASETATLIAMKARNHAPIELCAKEGVEVKTPDRVRKVPKSASENARITSRTFQIRSIPRRSWIITEWRNAVAASHGISAAFSTGSHA